MQNHKKAKHISNCLELAMLLEVTASKPGNVTLTTNFEGTRIEHFLASAVAAESSFEKAAQCGIAVSKNKLKISEVGIGQMIKECAADINAWQKGGNTLLGTVMLFVPIAVAAAMTPTEENFVFDFSRLRANLRLTVESTSAQDAIDLYEAIDIAKPSGLGEAPDLDVTNPASKARLLKENVTLFEVFKIAADYDDICFEWVRNYPITFDLAYPQLMKQLEQGDLNAAVVHTFLEILSERPDTFIARKAGVEKARKVSLDAKDILKLGGLKTSEGKKSIIELDKRLRASGNMLNPGTTADLTAAALALCILGGYRP
jgi:triphosphoribosyl-dephospho-CoA synthase